MTSKPCSTPVSERLWSLILQINYLKNREARQLDQGHTAAWQSHTIQLYTEGSLSGWHIFSLTVRNHIQWIKEERIFVFDCLLSLGKVYYFLYWNSFWWAPKSPVILRSPKIIYGHIDHTFISHLKNSCPVPTRRQKEDISSFFHYPFMGND
jgi:hypothetical protein